MKVFPREHHLQHVSGYSMQDCLNSSVKCLGGFTGLMKLFYSVSETEKETPTVLKLLCRNAVDKIWFDRNTVGIK
jgi:hypothetical protein